MRPHYTRGREASPIYRPATNQPMPNNRRRVLNNRNSRGPPATQVPNLAIMSRTPRWWTVSLAKRRPRRLNTTFRKIESRRCPEYGRMTIYLPTLLPQKRD